MVALITIKEFLAAAASGGINEEEFIASVSGEVREIQERYAPFITINAAPDRQGATGALSMLPVSVKDCICTAGLQTTAGSRILEGYVPPFDATCISRARGAGAIIIGKTAQDEFGFGTFSTNCAYGVPRNPYDVSRSCGGSSGGAACVAAAATFPHVAIAESTGGSITAPAAFTGTVGLTPTYGRVSRYGLIDYSNSMDKIGIIAKEVYGTALALSAIAGQDPLDQTSARQPVPDLTRCCGVGVNGMRIGVPAEYLEGVDEHILSLFNDRIGELEAAGANVAPTTLPMTRFAVAAYYIIAMSEASTNLARYSGMRYGAHEELAGSFGAYFSKVRGRYFGREAKRRIILGTYARAVGFRDAYYLKALRIRRMIVNEFMEAFGRFDLLASPAMPMVAPRFDEIERITPAQAYSADRLTTAPNMAGMPTISVPTGKVGSMPAGMQLIAGAFQEHKLIAAAAAAESMRWMR